MRERGERETRESSRERESEFVNKKKTFFLFIFFSRLFSRTRNDGVVDIVAVPLAPKMATPFSFSPRRGEFRVSSKHPVDRSLDPVPPSENGGRGSDKEEKESIEKPFAPIDLSSPSIFFRLPPSLSINSTPGPLRLAPDSSRGPASEPSDLDGSRGREGSSRIKR